MKQIFTFSHLKQLISLNFTQDGWVKVFDEDIYCELTPDNKTELAIERINLDDREYRPRLWWKGVGDDISCQYIRYENAIEPLVIYRASRGKYSQEIKISEEFILYFNLREKSNNGVIELVDIGCDEEDVPVVKIRENGVMFQAKYLKHFLAVKEMNLVITFYSERFTDRQAFETFGDLSELYGTTKTEHYIYDYSIRPADIIEGGEICATFRGKAVIPYEAHYKNVSLYENYNKFEDFIVGIDNDGEEIRYTCEGKRLSFDFAPIPGAPYAYTPIFFKKEVLDKYYNNPNKYTVDYGLISCKGQWSLRIDNNHRDYVVAFLVDLGKINHKEQLYWKSHNIPKQEGMGLSEPAYKSWIEGCFDTYPVVPDLYLKNKYVSFNEVWFSKYKSYLFKPLEKDDLYRIENLHSLTSEYNISDFESQASACAKIFVDSLNKDFLKLSIEQNANTQTVKEFVSYLLKKNKMNEKESKLLDILEKASSLELLEVFLKLHDAYSSGMMEFLRKLQALRSSRIAHRKSSKPHRNLIDYFNMDSKTDKNILDDIFIKLVWTLNTLEISFL